MRPTYIVLLSAFLQLTFGFSLTTGYLKYFRRKAIDIIDQAGPNDDCARQLKAWIGELFGPKSTWAMKMLDASAKLQTGLYSFNIFHFGDFDGCLNIKEEKIGMGIIEGKYCTAAVLPAQNSSSDLAQILNFVTIVPEMTGSQKGKDMQHILKILKVIYGLCLPKACSALSIQKLWNHLEASFKMPLRVAVDEDFCTFTGKVPFVFQWDTIVIWGFVVYAVFVLAATVCDLSQLTPRGWIQLLRPFSLYRNARKILLPGKKASWGCLDGLKVFSMCWVIFGHVYTIEILTGTTNMVSYFQWRNSLSSLLVLMAPFAVDTFLVISGLLLAYKCLEVRQALGGFPFLQFYLGRFFRLWPTLLATILLYTHILKYLGDGPIWPLIAHKTALTCRYSGWATAMFVTNFVKFQHQCIEPSWYLAVDCQLYCLAPALLLLFYKSPKSACLSLIGLWAWSAGHAYNTTVRYKENWTPAEGDDSFHLRIYQSTLVRLPPWVLGLVTGALIYHKPPAISSLVARWLWGCTSFLLVGVIVAHHALMLYPYNEYHSALFNATARSAWGLAICLLILLCLSGHGGVVNWVLSLELLRPLVRISYSVFLLHSAVIAVLHGQKRTPGHQTTFNSLQDFIADLPFILLASFVWCLLFEAPFIGLAKLLVGVGIVGRRTTLEKTPVGTLKLA
ncbi:nose resistant to fluoxetine protein 6 isoform X2 [Dendroctonus ponderosae]|uniref:Nose resistant-to-fluoxetine protein N-terminal domain-containing protein n=2 Tax=Dendroctonus ponderosae TaxID=77166 RepID=A0AAR5PL01_DENPD|nr:nose resistant to fluoxetine protein 6 isoform X2 [Dendroctonus ponderosae]